MIKQIYKKILYGAVITVLVGAPLLTLLPAKTAKAQLAVIDPINLVENTISAIYNGVTSVASYSLNYKELVLDGVANALVKQIARQVTTSVVNWINSGFEGSPSFITNPGGFFADLAGDIIGDFVASNSDLAYLCSPFSIDIRLALAFKYRPYQRNRYACTLDDIIRNVKGAVQGSTLNGFLSGDFSQGGWPAFVSMTTEPQNNVYGAYLQADSELSFRIADAVSQQKDELNQGRGFMSWKVCKDVPVAGDANFVGPTLPNDYQGPGAFDNTTVGSDFVGPLTPGQTRRTQSCETQTPGSVIQGVLDKQLGVPTDQLNLADEFNEIVNALFAQLVTQVLTGGLKGVSGSGSSDINSYINQIQNEQSQYNEQLNTTRQQLLNNMDTYIRDTERYKAVRDETYNLMFTVKNTLENARACYSVKLTENRVPPLSNTQRLYAEAKISDIQSFGETRVNPLTAELLGLSLEASDRLRLLNSIKERALAATTVNDIAAPVRDFTTLIQGQRLTSQIDVKRAEDKREEVKRIQPELKSQADRYNIECQAFPLFR